MVEPRRTAEQLQQRRTTIYASKSSWRLQRQSDDPLVQPTNDTLAASKRHSRSITDLPNELGLEVANYLDAPSIVKLAATCKKLQEDLGDRKACWVWDWLRYGNSEARSVPICDLQPWARTHLSKRAFTRFGTSAVSNDPQRDRLFRYLVGSHHVPWDALADKLMSRQQPHLFHGTLKEIIQFLIENGASKTQLDEWARIRAKEVYERSHVVRWLRGRAE
jgi:hypothetical protein